MRLVKLVSAEKNPELPLDDVLARTRFLGCLLVLVLVLLLILREAVVLDLLLVDLVVLFFLSRNGGLMDDFTGVSRSVVYVAVRAWQTDYRG